MLVAIVRHAKAEKDAPSGLDMDRALTERGQRQAAFLAEKFAAWSIRPDVVVASRARRTRETAAVIAEGCGVDFDFDDRLLVERPVSGAVEVVREHAGTGVGAAGGGAAGSPGRVTSGGGPPGPEGGGAAPQRRSISASSAARVASSASI